MLTNYLKSAIRFLKQNKVFAGINALGLSIALTASFIMLLYVVNELSFDHCHKNRARVFKVLNYFVDFKRTDTGTPYVLATALKEEFPQIEKSIRTRRVIDFKIKLKDEFINVPDAVGTDSEVFDIFTLPLVFGNPHENLLEDQNSIVLSHQLSEKIFPGQNPVGKEIVGITNKEEHVFKIKGVYENIPENSTFRAQCFINSRWTLISINKSYKSTDADKNWDYTFWYTWVLLSKDCNAESLEKQFRTFEIKNISEKPIYHYSLQNLSDVYLHSDKVTNARITGSIKSIRLYSAIALLIVLVATFNYIILSTAVSTYRTKEIGIRKTYGASNKKIKNQLLGESLLLALLVLPIALFLTWISLPYAGKLFQTQLHIISSNILKYILVYLSLTLIIGFISGIYTSYYLSGLKVMDILRNTLYSGKRKLFFRSSLILIQLVIFCSFVSSTLIIRSQYQYALKKDLGYYNQDIVIIDLGEGFKGYSAFINSIKSNPNVIMAAGTIEGLPMQNSGTSILQNFQDNNIQVQVENMSVDYNFLKTMGISVSKGREFSEDFGSDLTRSVILNETAVKQLGITDPIGKLIRSSVIIGIVKDFNLHSIHTDIPPLEIHLTDRFIEQVVVHYKPGTFGNILPMLKAEWKKAAPERPFYYTTIEDLIKSIYSSEKNLSNIISIFALFTMLIAGVGLFGLTLFVIKTQTKEIGIKKVFGSSENSIVISYLLRNFTIALLAAALSVPVTLYFMINWLKNYSYKVPINLWIFAVSFIVATIVVLMTVSIHSYKASRINPIKALKYE
jgi:putative ABC transport system permease protein